ncbi:MAG TPA: CoA pyrophosphatase [Spirochaetes bacterium]|nr:CoA pyrophosphatase [Spirochaetota bacterium]
MIKKIESILKDRPNKSYPPSDLVPAAVLIPLLYIDDALHILFTKRSQQVEHHKGEISFPGGTLDDTDSSLLGCALRECHEEIGLLPEDTHIIGLLDDFRTVVTHFVVTPFVGHIPHPYPFQVSAYEIDELIFIPISSLLDPSNYARKDKMGADGHLYHLDYFYYQEHTIWGATGFILKQFLELVYQFSPEQPTLHNPHRLID